LPSSPSPQGPLLGPAVYSCGLGREGRGAWWTTPPALFESFSCSNRTARQTLNERLIAMCGRGSSKATRRTPCIVCQRVREAACLSGGSRQRIWDSPSRPSERDGPGEGAGVRSAAGSTPWSAPPRQPAQVPVQRVAAEEIPVVDGDDAHDGLYNRRLEGLCPELRWRLAGCPGGRRAGRPSTWCCPPATSAYSSRRPDEPASSWGRLWPACSTAAVSAGAPAAGWPPPG
jgi:hypothetical protein